MFSWIQWCCSKQLQPRNSSRDAAATDAVLIHRYSSICAAWEQATQHPRLKFGSFCCCRHRCMFALVRMMYWLLVLIVFVRRLYSTHDLCRRLWYSTRDLSRRLYRLFVVFSCPFLSFPSSASYLHFPCVSCGLLRFIIGTIFRFQYPVFAGTTRTSSFVLILNQPSASRQVRAWDAPEAVAYYEYKVRQ